MRRGFGTDGDLEQLATELREALEQRDAALVRATQAEQGLADIVKERDEARDWGVDDNSHAATRAALATAERERGEALATAIRRGTEADDERKAKSQARRWCGELLRHADSGAAEGNIFVDGWGPTGSKRKAVESWRSSK